MPEARNAPTQVTDDVVEAVLVASRALVAVSARSIGDASEVTLPQFRMLVILESDPSNLSDLAGALQVAPSTALRMVERLVASGLVDRSVPPDNRREIRLELTELGRDTVLRVNGQRRRDLRAVIGRMPQAQQDGLADALGAFAAAADDLWPGIDHRLQ